MGVTYRATTAIGVRVKLSKLWKSKKEFHSCPQGVKFDEYKYPGYGQYCGQCGQKNWRGEDTPVADYDGDERLGPLRVKKWDVEGATLGVLAYCSQTVRSGDTEEERSMLMVTDVDIEVIKQNLKEYLEPRGLWDEDAFGVWTLLGA